MANRIKGVSLERALMIGSIAFALDNPSAEGKTHRWTVFVRDPDDGDLSHIIRKVTFVLHPTFANPIRDIESPPFELTEEGYGEFEIKIRLHFADPTEKPLEISHFLRLYAGSNSIAVPLVLPESESSFAPILAQQLEVLLFHEPSETMHSSLLADISSSSLTKRPLSNLVQRIISFSQSSSFAASASSAPASALVHLESIEMERLTGVSTQIDQEIMALEQKLNECSSEGRALAAALSRLEDIDKSRLNS